MALLRAGILHRDVSVGNVLIKAASTHENPSGFLHDFDCAIMSAEPPKYMPSSQMDPDEAEWAIYETHGDSLRTRVVSVIVIGGHVMGH